MALFVCLSSFFLPAAHADLAAQRRSSNIHSEASVRAYVASRFGDDRQRFPDARYALAWVDLNSDGRNEAVVRAMGDVGDRLCGSGGCNMYVLSPYRQRWSLVGRMTVTQLPIRVLNTRSHGWRDLGVFVRGGGILPGYEARLSYDGRIYPLNPTTPPSRRAARGTAGRVLIADDNRGRPLF